VICFSKNSDIKDIQVLKRDRQGRNLTQSVKNQKITYIEQ